MISVNEQHYAHSSTMLINMVLDTAIKQIEDEYKVLAATGFANKTHRDVVRRHVKILEGLRR